MTRPRIRNIDAAEVARLRATGMGWERIGKSMGLAADTVRRAVDPGFAERRGGRIRETMHAGRIDHGTGGMSAEAKRDAGRLLAQIPTDTRGFTARLCGDPIPSRSALARRQA